MVFIFVRRCSPVGMKYKRPGVAEKSYGPYLATALVVPK